MKVHIGVAYIVLAVSAAVTILAAAVNSEHSGNEAQASEPRPSRIIATFPLNMYADAIEFRDSAGRICVYVERRADAVALDCGYAARPDERAELLPERPGREL